MTNNMKTVTSVFPRILAVNAVKRLTIFQRLFFGLFIFLSVAVWTVQARAESGDYNVPTTIEGDLSADGLIYAGGNSPSFTANIGSSITRFRIIRDSGDVAQDLDFQNIDGVWTLAANPGAGEPNLDLSSSTVLDYLHSVTTISPDVSLVGDSFDAMVGKLVGEGYQVFNIGTGNLPLIIFKFSGGNDTFTYAADPRFSRDRAAVAADLSVWQMEITFESSPDTPIIAVFSFVGAPSPNATFESNFLNRAKMVAGTELLLSLDYAEPMDNSISPTLACDASGIFTDILTDEGSWRDDSSGEYKIFDFRLIPQLSGLDTGIESYTIGLSVSGAQNLDGLAQLGYDVPAKLEVDIKKPTITSLSASFSKTGVAGQESDGDNYILNNVQTDDKLSILSFEVEDGALNQATFANATILLPGQSSSVPFAGDFVYSDPGIFTWQSDSGFTLSAGTSTIYVVFKDLYENSATASVTLHATALPSTHSGGGGGGIPYISPVIIVDASSTIPAGSEPGADSQATSSPIVGEIPTTTVSISPATTTLPFKAVLGEKVDILDQLIAQTKYRTRGQKVSLLQYELRKRGYFPKWHRITGYYGPITKASVAKYLKTKKLSLVQ